MRVIFPACAAATIGLSIWLMGALVAPGPIDLPEARPPAANVTPGEPAALDDMSRHHGPRGPFVLTGRVVDSATGDPIQNANVDVSSDDIGVFGSTTTDQRGHWTLNRLPAGVFNVTVRKAEYQIRSSGLPLIALADDRPQKVLNVALARGSALSGRITDSAGRPAVGTNVTVLRAVHNAGETTFRYEGDSTQADESGWFRLSGLRDGEYVLAAQVFSRLGPATSSRTQVTTFYPGTTTSTDAQRFTLIAGTTRTGLTFALQSLPSVTVSGHVITSTGQQVPAEVTVEHRNSGVFSGGATFFGGRPPSSEFSIRHLTRGRYRLIGRTEPLNGLRESGSIDITVGDSDMAGLVIRTAQPTILRGRVVAQVMSRGIWTG